MAPQTAIFPIENCSVRNFSHENDNSRTLQWMNPNNDIDNKYDFFQSSIIDAIKTNDFYCKRLSFEIKHV